MSLSNINTKNLLCTIPFEKIEVQEDGTCYFCCKKWLDKTIGNINTTSFEQIWNSIEAQEIRKSILDGSFRYCDKQLCPHLQQISKPVVEKEKIVELEYLGYIKDNSSVLDVAPSIIRLTHDQICNLSCPSCRKGIFQPDAEQKQFIDSVYEKVRDELATLTHLKLIGSGDAFASKKCLDFLKSISIIKYPRLKISIMTNGTLFNETIWNSIKHLAGNIVEISVSIDAATPETYAINRRGGRFEDLLRGLSLMKQLRQTEDIQYFTLNFVVQKNNWREMHRFVKLGEDFGVDKIHFTQITNWDTFTDAELRAHSVHLPEHPEFTSFVSALKDVAKNPIVDTQNLTYLITESNTQNLETIPLASPPPSL